jgi:hypothetical protein
VFVPVFILPQPQLNSVGIVVEEENRTLVFKPHTQRHPIPP